MIRLASMEGKINRENLYQNVNRQYDSGNGDLFYCWKWYESGSFGKEKHIGRITQMKTGVERLEEREQQGKWISDFDIRYGSGNGVGFYCWKWYGSDNFAKEKDIEGITQMKNGVARIEGREQPVKLISEFDIKYGSGNGVGFYSW